MEVLVDLRIERLINEMNTAVASKTTATDVEAAIKIVRDKAEKEGREFNGLKGNPEQVLRTLADYMLTGTNKASWKEPTMKAITVLRTLAPANFKELTSLYLQNIDSGSVTFTLSNKSPDDYNKYFLYQVYAASGGKLPYNEAIEEFVNFFSTKRQVDLASVRLNAKKYTDWAARGGPSAPIPELDTNEDARKLAEAAKEKLRKQKTKAKEQFMKWFGKEKDVSSWMKLDGAWQAIQGACRNPLRDGHF